MDARTFHQWLLLLLHGGELVPRAHVSRAASFGRLLRWCTRDGGAAALAAATDLCAWAGAVERLLAAPHGPADDEALDAAARALDAAWRHADADLRTRTQNMSVAPGVCFTLLCAPDADPAFGAAPPPPLRVDAANPLLCDLDAGDDDGDAADPTRWVGPEWP